MQKIVHTFEITFVPNEAPVVVERLVMPRGEAELARIICPDLGTTPFEAVVALASEHASKFAEFTQKKVGQN